jgi:hypothetical protein
VYSGVELLTTSGVNNITIRTKCMLNIPKTVLKPQDAMKKLYILIQEKPSTQE